MDSIWGTVKTCAQACIEFVRAGFASTEFHQWLSTSPGMVITILLFVTAVCILMRALRTSVKAGFVCVVVLSLLTLVFPGVASKILIFMQ